MIRSTLGAAWNYIGKTVVNVCGRTLSSNYESLTRPSLALFSRNNTVWSNPRQEIDSSSWKNTKFLEPLNCSVSPTRDLTKFSLQKGKRKAVKAVLKRFYRLDWGIWIHGKCGRNKKLHTKSANRKRRLRQHVFCNASQSHLLDKMVTSYWRRRKYYVDDPYEPYHTREEFPFTRKKPQLPIQ